MMGIVRVLKIQPSKLFHPVPIHIPFISKWDAEISVLSLILENEMRTRQLLQFTSFINSFSPGNKVDLIINKNIIKLD